MVLPASWARSTVSSRTLPSFRRRFLSRSSTGSCGSGSERQPHRRSGDARVIVGSGRQRRFPSRDRILDGHPPPRGQARLRRREGGSARRGESSRTGARRARIRVNVIAPGLTDTPMVRRFLATSRAGCPASRSASWCLPKRSQRWPYTSYPTPEHMTGAVFSVDGGRTAG